MASAKVGGMTFAEEASIRENLSLIRQTLDPGDIIWLMIQKSVMSMANRQEIMKQNPDTTEARCSKFLELLRKGNSRTFDAFVKSLKEKKYTDLATSITASLERHQDPNKDKFKAKHYRKGKLSKTHANRVTQNISDIVEELDAKDIIDIFVEENLVDKTGEESVRRNNPDTKRRRTEAFLELLFDMDDRAYDVLIKALRTKGYGDLLDKIERTETPQEGQNDADHLVTPFDRMAIRDKDIPTLPDDILKRHPKDLQLNRLAREIGSFKVLARELKVKDAKVQQVILDNPNDTTEQCYQILKHWRTLASNQGAAHIQDLISACQRANLDIEPSVYIRIFSPGS